jgi:hypothetical protein
MPAMTWLLQFISQKTISNLVLQRNLVCTSAYYQATKLEPILFLNTLWLFECLEPLDAATSRSRLKKRALAAYIIKISNLVPNQNCQRWMGRFLDQLAQSLWEKKWIHVRIKTNRFIWIAGRFKSPHLVQKEIETGRYLYLQFNN